jgi:hypothetical protein
MKKAGIISGQQYRKDHTAASGSESASYPDQLQMGGGMMAMHTGVVDVARGECERNETSSSFIVQFSEQCS